MSFLSCGGQLGSEKIVSVALESINLEEGGGGASWWPSSVRSGRRGLGVGRWMAPGDGRRGSRALDRMNDKLWDLKSSSHCLHNARRMDSEESVRHA